MANGRYPFFFLSHLDALRGSFYSEDAIFNGLSHGDSWTIRNWEKSIIDRCYIPDTANDLGLKVLNIKEGTKCIVGYFLTFPPLLESEKFQCKY